MKDLRSLKEMVSTEGTCQKYVRGVANHRWSHRRGHRRRHRGRHRRRLRRVDDRNCIGSRSFHFLAERASN